MNRRSTGWIVVLVIAAVMFSACGGRMPKNKTASNVINGYFHKYGKKYKETDFGRSKIQSVDISDVQEIHKNMVAATAYVKLQDGSVWSVRCVLEKKTLGWHFVSWEKM